MPLGRSFFGCGTITVCSPLRNFACEPFVETCCQPSFWRRLTMSLLFHSMYIYVHTVELQVKRIAQINAHGGLMRSPPTRPFLVAESCGYQVMLSALLAAWTHHL
ncbi:hypothetical protein NOVOSPHI9U_800003 [Novosphingobium sp. 9U]|nr:hypothetical protein NOVOSPHI9U_800003 [Novosphingobium sp. 9U]